MTITIHTRSGDSYKVKIDSQDVPLFANKKLYVYGHPSRKYVHCYHSKTSGGNGRSVPIGRMILSAPPGMDVDHINGDTLDNRRINLRVVTRSDNQLNQHRKRATHGKPTSKYVGVLWNKRDKVWTGYVQYRGNRWTKNFKKEWDAYVWRREIRDRILNTPAVL